MMHAQRHAVLEATDAPASHSPGLVAETPLSRALVVGGAALFALCVWQSGAGMILEQLQAMSWRLLLVVLPYALGAACDTLGWWYAFPHPGCPVRYSELLRIRLAAKALQEMTPAIAQVGEAAKIHLLLVKRTAWPMAVTSVIAAKTSITLAELVFLTAGLLLVVTVSPAAAQPISDAWIGVLTSAVLLLGVVGWQRYGFFHPLIRLSRYAKILDPIRTRYESRLREVDTMLAALLRERPKQFGVSCVWHGLGWVAGALEGWVILVLLGVPADVSTVLVIESLIVIVQGTTSFIPANLGTAEAGTMLIFTWLGYPPEMGMTFAVLRRLRQVAWVALGLTLLRRLLSVNRCPAVN